MFLGAFILLSSIGFNWKSIIFINAFYEFKISKQKDNLRGRVKKKKTTITTTSKEGRTTKTTIIYMNGGIRKRR